MGLTVANVGGVPAATWLGQQVGWCLAFGGTAVLGGVVIDQGFGYAAVPLVGAVLAAGGLGLVWIGNAGSKEISIHSSSTSP